MMSTLLPFIFVAIKIIIIVGLLVYVAFASIIVRQEQLMTNVLEEGFESVLRVIVLVHLAASIGVLVLAFMLL